LAAFAREGRFVALAASGAFRAAFARGWRGAFSFAGGFTGGSA
jgi:hypothetical protein